MSDTDVIDSQIEIRARNMGWKPESEWDDEQAARDGKRKPKVFKTAEEYVRDVDASVPILRERNEFLSNEVTKLNGRLGEIDELKTKLDDTGRLAEHLLESQKRSADAAYQRGIEATEKRMKQAVKESDDEAYDAAKADRDRLEEERAVETTEVAPPEPPRREPESQRRDDNGPEAVEARRREMRKKLDPETRTWVEANSWFDDSLLLNQAMMREFGRVKVERPGVGVTDALNEAKRRVQDKFPEEFGLNPARDAPPTVGRPGPGGQHTNGHAFADVPREDQESFKRQQKIMKERGVEFTEQEFLDRYEW